MRYSFGILKPDCLRRGLVADAVNLVCELGLKIIYLRRCRLATNDAEFLYSRCKGSDFFPGLVEFMTSGEVILYIVESENGVCAIECLNKATGYTDPVNAKPRTLRSMGRSIRENIAHSTADQDTFWSEVRYFLTDDEINELRLGA